MSWTVDRMTEHPCRCGAGVVRVTHRSNDWMQTEQVRDILCEPCAEKIAETRRRREEIDVTVRRLADERHLSRWLAAFAGLTKKEVWALSKGTDDYPSLATFYKHVRHEGLTGYLTRHFRHDVAKALAILGLQDPEITALLDELGDLRAGERRGPREAG